MWGFDCYDDYGAPYNSMAPVSQSALAKLERAKSIFTNYMDTLPLERCPVTHDLLNFHLLRWQPHVTDCRKKFKQFVEPHHVVLKWRKEQVKGRKSDVWLATISVSPGAKQAWMVSQHGAVDAARGGRDQQAGPGPSTSNHDGPVDAPPHKRAKVA